MDGLLRELTRRIKEEWQAARNAEFARVIGDARFGGGWGWKPDWFCEVCGGPQAGASPWEGGQRRCRQCGPGEGFAPCPASHGRGRCVLCKGTGYVEVIP